MSGNFTIEARSLSILGVASHDFWVLRDGDGNAIAELVTFAKCNNVPR